jgi:energy-coupling factor transporter transmembrane protein EcfT
MKFESKKDVFFSGTILVMCFLLIAITVEGVLNKKIGTNEYWVLIVILGVVILLFSLFFNTHYSLSKEHGLIYQSGPFKGKISIDRITKVEKGKTLWVGLKPATARKGLIIKYDKYNEIYISPKTNESFIEKLLEINPNIIVE